MVAYTATRWRKLLSAPRGWDGPVMTAGDCYRFCLSSPHVDVVLCGPKNGAQLRENLAALEHFAPAAPVGVKVDQDVAIITLRGVERLVDAGQPGFAASHGVGRQPCDQQAVEEQALGRHLAG